MIGGREQRIDEVLQMSLAQKATTTQRISHGTQALTISRVVGATLSGSGGFTSLWESSANAQRRVGHDCLGLPDAQEQHQRRQRSGARHHVHDIGIGIVGDQIGGNGEAERRHQKAGQTSHIFFQPQNM